MPEVAIDAHVHFHAPDAAVGQLVAACRRLKVTQPRQAARAFVLTEQPGRHAFTRIATTARPTRDPAAVWMMMDRAQVLVVAGRQLVSAEGVEVLGIGCRGDGLSDGVPTAQAIAAVRAHGGIAVLPWGAGKWLGRRGRHVAALLAADPALILGDNGGRPRFWRSPLLARRRLLSGSDPLLLSGSWARIGTFGTLLHSDLGEDDPLAALKRAISDPATALRPFGQPASARRFLEDQAMMRLRA